MYFASKKYKFESAVLRKITVPPGHDVVSMYLNQLYSHAQECQNSATDGVDGCQVPHLAE